MKTVLLIACCSICALLVAENSNSVYISDDQIVVHFDENLTKGSMKEIIKQFTTIDFSRTIFLERLDLVVVRSNKNISFNLQVRQQITNLKEVESISPVLCAPGVGFVGVLNQVFVKLKNEGQLKVLTEIATELKLKTVREKEFFKNVFVLEADNNSTGNAWEVALMLNELGMFEYAEPNLLFSPVVTTNDPLFNRQWNLKNDGTGIQWNGVAGADISIEDAWTITQGDSTIKVAILDSGADTLHPDLTPNLLPGFDATGDSSKGYPNLDFSNDGHGTACAGIVAAVSDNGLGVSGVAPNCKIVPVKVFFYVDTLIGTMTSEPIPFSTSQWFADGIAWAHQVAKVDVMSNSWGVHDLLFGILQGPISLVEDAIDQAVTNGRNGLGIPILFSSGNEDSSPLWPSRLPNTIAVTATSMCDERKNPNSCDGEDWGGNFGSEIDVGAPGVKIPTTDMIGRDGYSVGSYMTDFNGTSAACPNAAGVMALILSVRPDLTAWQARVVLGRSADRVGGYNYGTVKYAGSWSSQLGFGRVNAFNAVTNALAYTGVEQSENSQNATLLVYPNPITNAIINLSYQVNEPSTTFVKVYNADGKLAYSASKRSGIGGKQYIRFHLTELSAGIYILELSMNGISQRKKFVVL